MSIGLTSGSVELKRPPVFIHDIGLDRSGQTFHGFGDVTDSSPVAGSCGARTASAMRRVACTPSFHDPCRVCCTMCVDVTTLSSAERTVLRIGLYAPGHRECHEADPRNMLALAQTSALIRMTGAHLFSRTRSPWRPRALYGRKCYMRPFRDLF